MMFRRGGPIRVTETLTGFSAVSLGPFVVRKRQLALACTLEYPQRLF
jgi:hypothetical protein